MEHARNDREYRSARKRSAYEILQQDRTTQDEMRCEQNEMRYTLPEGVRCRRCTSWQSLPRFHEFFAVGTWDPSLDLNEFHDFLMFLWCFCELSKATKKHRKNTIETNGYSAWLMGTKADRRCGYADCIVASIETGKTWEELRSKLVGN